MLAVDHSFNGRMKGMLACIRVHPSPSTFFWRCSKKKVDLSDLEKACKGTEAQLSDQQASDAIQPSAKKSILS